MDGTINKGESRLYLVVVIASAMGELLIFASLTDVTAMSED